MNKQWVQRHAFLVVLMVFILSISYSYSRNCNCKFFLFKDSFYSGLPPYSIYEADSIIEKEAGEDTAITKASDSLKAAIEKADWKEAAKASFKLSEILFEYGMIDKSIQIALKGVEYAQKANDALWEALNYHRLGFSYFSKYDYAKSMEYSMKSLKLAVHFANPVLVLELNNRIGFIYKRVGEYEKAKEYLLPAYKQVQLLHKGPLADLLMNLGNVEEALGNYEQSLEYYKKYLACTPNNRYRQVLAYNNIASVYLKLKQVEKASALYQKAYLVEDTITNPTGRSYSFYDFARVSRDRGDYKTAIQYAQKSLELNEPFHVKNLEQLDYEILAACYKKTGNYEAANTNLVKFTAIKDSVLSQIGIDKIKVLDAAYRVELETEKKQQEINSLHRQNALKQLEVANLRNKNRISLLQLANANKEKSLNGLQLKNLLQKDSLNRLRLDNYNKQAAVNNLKFQSLNQQNKLNKLELSVQRRNLLLLIAGTVLLLIASLFYYRRHRLNKLLELEKLRSGIAEDFHDEVGSTLSSISLYSDMALWNNNADAGRLKGILLMIGEASRGTISSMYDMIWSIHPKNDSINEVVQRIQEYAYPLAEARNICLKLNIENDVRVIQPSMIIRKNVYLIFKEALNNAFKYSLAQNINVHLYCKKRILHLTIQDNGCGFDPATLKNGHGLKNMNKRATQAGGKIEIKSSPSAGTSVYFTCAIG